MKKYILSHIILSLFALNIFSQQMPNVSLFGDNQAYYNPGFVGNQEVLSANFFFRANWVGIDGAPVTEAFLAHTPMRDPAVAMGILVEHDALGSTGYTGIYINYAYRVKIGVNKLSFGVKGGITNESLNYILLRDNVPDPAFSDNNQTFFYPNFGIGVAFTGRQYWAGFSVPRLFGYDSKGSDSYKMAHDFWRYEYFLTGGGRFNAGPDLAFEPSALLVYSSRYNYVDKINVSLMAMGIYKGAYKAGLGFRLHDAIIIAVGYQLNRQFSLAYSYDLGLWGAADYSNGSHEINLNYKFGYKVNASNPRGF